MVTIQDAVYSDERKQGEIANAAGITKPALSRILNKHTKPQERTLYKLSKALGVDRSELVSEIGGAR